MKPRPYQRGTKISQSGLYSGVPISTYHGPDLCDGPSVSSSGLRTIFSESAAHYWVRSPYNPHREPQDETDAFTLGRAAHHLLLGEDDFSTLFVMRPELLHGKPWQGNRLDCKAWLREQEKAGRTVLTPSQVQAVRGIARSLAAHPLVAAGMLNGAIEQTMVWRCKDTGIWKKARPDVIPLGSGDFVDLKTTVSVATDQIKRTIAEHGYHQQGALICEGWHALTGDSNTTFTLVFVEKTPPYCVRIVEVPNEDLARGEMQNFAAAATFKQCMETGDWPGPGRADAEFLSLPEWAQKRIDYQLGLTQETA